MGLRVGLHSGAVTAGILRGDRARFQLFGDTVNTTTHVLEKVALPNQILVSQQTADRLVQAGKKRWVQPIAAIGDSIQLFELNIRVPRRGSVASSAGSTGSGDSVTSVDVEEPVIDKDHDIDGVPPLDEIKKKLVDWNCNQLERLLRQIVANREVLRRRQSSLEHLHRVARAIGRDSIPAEEVAEAIQLPEFNTKLEEARDIDSVMLDDEIIIQVSQVCCVSFPLK